MIGRILRWARKATFGTYDPEPWKRLGLVWSETTSGIKVDPVTALKCAAVYACVRVVSEDVAKLPLTVYRRRGDRGRTPATDHPLFDLLRRRPNSWQSSYEWREMMQAHVELRGNAFAYVARDGGGSVTALVPVHPDRVTMRVTGEGDIFYDVTARDHGPPIPTTVGQDNMLHLRGMSLDGYWGLSTIAWQRETIGLTMAATQHGAAYFGNGARPDVVLKGASNQDQAKEIRNAWERLHKGSKNAHRPAVLPGNMDVTTLGISNKDSQFLELREFQVTDIARAFRIPPHKIGSLARATFSNIEQQALEYYQEGLMPRLERFEAALERDLLTERERGQYVIEFDFTRILRGDMQATMNAIAMGRQWGLLSVNDGRQWINLEPIPNGDDRLQPLNMVPLGTQQQSEPPAGLDDEDESMRNVIFLRRTVGGMRRAG